jgi:prepilin-type N-terminal cleavage/methylation domain-containing protein
MRDKIASAGFACARLPLGGSKRAFTLIELLITVAIISILAALALPNFLEFQTRAKVARAKADMRTLATGIEAYNVDNDSYIVALQTGYDPLSLRLIPLTTPIAYLTTVPPDPFVAEYPGDPHEDIIDDTFDYWDKESWRQRRMGVGGGIAAPSLLDNLHGRAWRLASAGPDLVMHYGDRRNTAPYDPTNGTVSRGDIVLLQGRGNGWPWYPDGFQPVTDDREQ